MKRLVLLVCLAGCRATSVVEYSSVDRLTVETRNGDTLHISVVEFSPPATVVVQK